MVFYWTLLSDGKQPEFGHEMHLILHKFSCISGAIYMIPFIRGTQIRRQIQAGLEMQLMTVVGTLS